MAVSISLNIENPPEHPRKKSTQWEVLLYQLLNNPGTWGRVAIIESKDCNREAKNLLQAIRYRMRKLYGTDVHVRTRIADLLPDDGSDIPRCAVFVCFETQLVFDFDNETPEEINV